MTAQFLDGGLTISSDADDAIEISIVADDVLVNGSQVGATALPPNSVESISVVGGPGSNVIDLSAVTAGQFTILQDVVVAGGPGDDVITGSDVADRITGGSGDDNLDGRLGDDVLVGNAGDDVIEGGSGNDRILGGAGNDRLTAGDGNDVIRGNAGGDIVTGGQGTDRFVGGSGYDVLEESADVDQQLTATHYLGLDVETWEGLEAADLDGGPGDNRIDGSRFPGPVNFDGAGGDDVLIGSAFGDILNGRRGNDRLEGNAGDDKLLGGSNDDWLDGGDGNDVLLAHHGMDVMLGRDGSDVLIGGDGADVIEGGPGDDELFGGGGSDLVFAGDGDDRIEGDTGNDRLFGGPGNDLIIGNAGHDQIDGEGGDDKILGGAGVDVLVGADGDDIVAGQGGLSNQVSGGSGDNRIIGPAEDVDETIAIDRTGLNQHPQLGPVGDVTIDEGRLVLVDVVASDLDIDDELVFSLLDAPDGIELDSLTGQLTWVPRRDVGPEEFRVTVGATDQAGLSHSRTFTVAVDDTAATIVAISPDDGEDLVSVTREAVVQFSEEIRSDTITSDSVRFLAAGEQVPGRLAVSSTDRFVTFFPDEPWDASTEVSVEIDGAVIRGANGMPLDADGDGEPGGELSLEFSTLPLTRVPGTNVWGYVFDAYQSLPIEELDIDIPAGDPYFDPFNTAVETMPFIRTRYALDTGTDDANPRRHRNQVSGFLDASGVYGSEALRAEALRSNDGTGRLKVSDGDLLPINNMATFPGGVLLNTNSGPQDPATLFAAGEIRANENIGLLALHTLFLREHNRVADEIATADPELSGDEIFERARHHVAALIQHITYQEYLPLLLGPDPLQPYTGYDAAIDPGVGIMFANAAFRYGHSQVFGDFPLIDDTGTALPESPLPLMHSFFTTMPLDDHGIDPILRGLVDVQVEQIDTGMINSIRNFLFGPPGAGGIDLASLNIQRGRDVALPGYNQARVDVGLSAVTTFEQISSDPTVQSALQTTYGSVDDIDVWVGGLAEDHLPGAMLGELFATSLRGQFETLRDGDRFWYENQQFTQAELDALRSTTLVDVVVRNSSISDLAGNGLTTGTVPAGADPAGAAADETASGFRSISGTGNNETNPGWGSTDSLYLLDGTQEYADGVSSPAGATRPSPREVSNTVFDQSVSIPNDVGATGLMMIWGQFLAHDVSLAEAQNPDNTNVPVVGATIRVDAFPEADAVTDHNGFFILRDMPSPDFYVHIDGSTATSSPAGTQYPSVGKAFHSIPGESSRLNIGGNPFDVFLPSMVVTDAQSLSTTEETQVRFGAGALDELAELFPETDVSVFDQLQVTIPAGSAQFDDGTPATQVTIVPVPADRLPAPLPEQIESALVVTIQMGGATNFDSPASIQWPNLDDLELGSCPTFWSFYHDQGAFLPVGIGTVIDDGNGGTVIVSAPGEGLPAPGWHTISDPLNWGGSGTVPSMNLPTTLVSDPEVSVMLFTTTDTDILKYTFNPPDGPGQNPGDHQAPVEDPFIEYRVAIEGPFSKFYKTQSGKTGFKSGTFTLKPGDRPVEYTSELMSLAELISANGGKAYDRDRLYGARITVTETRVPGDGTRLETTRILLPYLYVDQADDKADDKILKLANTVITDDTTFARLFDLEVTSTKSNEAGTAPTPTLVFEGSSSGDYSSTWTVLPSHKKIGSISFNPSAAGDRNGALRLEVTSGGATAQSNVGPQIEAKGTERQRLFVNTASLISALADLGVEERLRIGWPNPDPGNPVVARRFPMGQFTLSFGGDTTAAIDNNSNAAQIQTALRGLLSVPAGEVTVRPLNIRQTTTNVNGTPAPAQFRTVEVEFSGSLRYTAQRLTFTGVPAANGNPCLGTVTPRISKAETGDFDTGPKRTAIANLVKDRVDTLLTAFDPGIEVVDSMGTNTVQIKWDIKHGSTLLGTSGVSVGGHGTDDRIKIAAFVKTHTASTPVVQSFLLDQAVNLQLSTVAEVYVDTPMEGRDVSAMADARTALVNTLAKTAVHEMGHGVGAMHTYKTSVRLSGSINPTASANVVGVGTRFISQVKVGDIIHVSGQTRTVTAITDNINLTVNSAFSNGSNDTTPRVTRETVVKVNGVTVQGRTDVMTSGTDYDGVLAFREGLTSNVLQLGLNLGWTEVQGQRAVANYVAHYKADSRGYDSFDPPLFEEEPESEEELELIPIEGAVITVFNDDGTLNAGDVSFDPVLVDGNGGQQQSSTLTVLNFGSQDVVISNVEIDDPEGVFSVSGIEAGSVIAAGVAFPFDVIFDPESVGDVAAVLSIESNDEIRGSFAIGLSGLGLAPNPAFSLEIGNTGNNNLGGVALGSATIVDDMLTITNLGVDDLVFTPALSGGGADLFLGDFDGNVQTLSSLASVEIPVTFSPTTLGLRPGMIEFTTNDPEQPVVRQGIVGTGLPVGGIGVGDFDWGNDYVRIENGLITHQLFSDDGGNFAAGMPPGSEYSITIFDPESGYVATGSGYAGASGAFTDITGPLRFRAAESPDSDFDGLPDVVEGATGTSVNKADTDGDGLSDFFEISQGLDPAGGRHFPTGVIAGLDLPGTAEAIAVEGDLAYLATSNNNGLVIVDVTEFDNPILRGRLDLPGSARGVAVDPVLKIAALAVGGSPAQLALVDIADPNQPSLLQTVPVTSPVGGLFSEVVVRDGVAYAAAGSTLDVVDMVTGTILQTLELESTSGRVTGMVSEGAFLYAVQNESDVFSVIDIATEGEAEVVADLPIDISGFEVDVFAGDGVAWVAQSGLRTVDISDPTNPVLISDADSSFTARRIALNGSGIGLLLAGFGDAKVQGYDTRDPNVTNAKLLEYPLSGAANDVAIRRGLGYVAAGQRLEVVNYLAFDNQGQPPVVTISIEVPDQDPTEPGVQVLEGSSIPIRVDVTDDIQVRDVELLVNGEVVRNDVSYPFEFSASALGSLADTTTTSVQVRATDTGGNSALSQQLVLNLVPDTTPPTLVSAEPQDGAEFLEQTSGTTTVRLRFSESLDRDSVSSQTIVLRHVGGEVVEPEDFQLREVSRLVQAVYPRLTSDEYEVVISPTVSDRAGQPFSAQETIATRFEVLRRIELTQPADGDQVVEGTSLTLTAGVHSSLSPLSVTFTVNGQDVVTDSVAPYETTIDVAAVEDADTLTIGALMNETWWIESSAVPVTVSVVADTVGPRLQSVQPVDAGSLSAFEVDQLTLNFDEPLDAGSAEDENNYRLVRDVAGDGFGSSDDVEILVTATYDDSTRDVTLAFGSTLSAGNFRLNVDGDSSVLDRFGNRLNDGVDETRDFTISTSAATLPFAEAFSTSVLGDEWSSRSTGDGRIRVTGVENPRTGDFHVVLDGPGDTVGLNELVLSLDTDGQSDLELSFYHRNVDDLADSLPVTFFGSADGDGVSISVDGWNWHRIVDLAAMTPGADYEQVVVDLDVAVAAAGLALGSELHIKFQQYADGPPSNADRAFDDIRIAADAVGPIVTGQVPLAGQLEIDNVTQVVVTFDEPLDSASAIDVSNWELVGDGPDDQLDTSDDVSIPFTLVYDDTARTVTLTTDVSSQPLPADSYRLTIDGTATVTDAAGNPLNDGLDTVSVFDIFLPESPSNETPATATATGLNIAAGVYESRAAIDSDTDFYKLTAVSTQTISVFANVFEGVAAAGSLDMNIRVLDSAGQEVDTANDPDGRDASLVLTTTASDTYYVEVTSTDGQHGLYDLTIRLLASDNIAEFPFVEDFNNGSSLSSYWETNSTNTGRIRVSGEGSGEGDYHLLMDTAPPPYDPWLLAYTRFGSESSISAALMDIGLVESIDYHVADSDSFAALSVNDLADYDVIFVGSSILEDAGNSSGLGDDSNDDGLSDLDEALGDTSRVMLSGLAPDYGLPAPGQQKHDFLLNAVEWVRAGEGTGLVALADPAELWSWTSLADPLTLSSAFDENVVIPQPQHEVLNGLTGAGLSDWGPSYVVHAGCDAITDLACVAVDDAHTPNRGVVLVRDGLAQDPAPAPRDAALNEAILHIDLVGHDDVELSFLTIPLALTSQPIVPDDYTGSSPGDGVSISDDGTNWHTLRFSEPFAVIDLDEAAEYLGLTLNGDFQIKFQQHGFGPVPLRGRGYDVIQLQLDTFGPVVDSLSELPQAVPSQLELADINDDGDEDLLVMNVGNVSAGAPSSFGVLLGRGDGTFDPAEDFVVFDSPDAIAIGDIDNDGDEDIVVATTKGYNDGAIRLYRNDQEVAFGPGTFADSTIVPHGGTSGESMWETRSYTVELGLVDLNADGSLDILSFSHYDTAIVFQPGNGDGTFEAAARLELSESISSVALADMNGDGFLDPVVGTRGSGSGPRIFVMPSDGDGGFLPDLLETEIEWVAEHIRIDGVYPSIAAWAVSRDDQTNAFFVSTFSGDTDGKLIITETVPLAEPVSDMAVDDLDGDGNVDLLLTPSNDGYGNFHDPQVSMDLDIPAFLTVLRGTGDGAVSGEGDLIPLGTRIQPNAIAVADLNADGRLDVLVSAGDGGVHGGVVTGLLGTEGGGTEALPTFEVQLPAFLENVFDPTGRTVSIKEAGRLDEDSVFAEGVIKLVYAGLDGILGNSDDQVEPLTVGLDSNGCFGCELVSLTLTGEMSLTPGLVELVISGTGDTKLTDAEGNPLTSVDDGNGSGRDFVEEFLILENGPFVVFQDPGWYYGDNGLPGIDSILIEFSEPIDPTTFTVDDVTTFTGAGGASIIPSGVSGSGTSYTISFPTQVLNGNYEFVLGPDIQDPAGSSMNQDRDFEFGESIEDRYTGQFSLSHRLYDEDGFFYDLSPYSGAAYASGRTTVDGTGNRWGTYDNAYVLSVDEVLYSADPADFGIDDDARTFVYSATSLSNLDVHREIYVPESGGNFARFVEVLENPTDTDVTVSIGISGDLGSDSATEFIAASGGTPSLSGDDLWFVTDDGADGVGTAELGHVLQDGAGLVTSGDVSLAVDDFSWSFDVTIPAGETRRIMTFAVQTDSRQLAQDQAALLVDPPSIATVGLTAAELASIVNFALE